MLARVDSAETTVWPPQGELWSLGVLYQYAGTYANIATNLEECRSALILSLAEGGTDARQADQDRIRKVLVALYDVAERSEAHLPPLKRLQLRLGRLIVKMKEPMQAAVLRSELDNLRDGLGDELADEKFLAVKPELVPFYETDLAFGDDVARAFPKSIDDIDEAGKCLALGRNKATAFHLMLAMEEALRALADKIGADVFDKKKDQFFPWSMIVGNLKDKIPALPKDEQERWTEVHNLLWGVNKAWRNKTMHPAQNYTDKQARRLYDAVHNFMNDLAELV